MPGPMFLPGEAVSVQKGGLCPGGSLSRGGLCQGDPPKRDPPYGEDSTHSTGMLSCSSLILFLLNKQGYFIQLPVHLVL